MAPIRYSLHYEDYSEHLMSRFGKLLQMQSLVDMTLMCSSHTLRVHKAVLAASSAYFQEVLQKQTGEPLIILKMRFSVLKSLVEFMYCGKTQCLEENLDELVSAAQFLKIKGLCKVTKEGLGITNNGELPVFTPPVVINRPPQSLIESTEGADAKLTLPQPHPPSSTQPIDNSLIRNKNPVVRIPFDMDRNNAPSALAPAVPDYPEAPRAIKPRRGRPSRAGWEGGALGRAAQRALLRREQDSRKAINQLKSLQSRQIQDYMDRVTLSQAVNSICDPDSSSHNYMNMDNDFMYMDQTVSSNVLDPYNKAANLGADALPSNYPSSVSEDPNGSGVGSAMSEYVNALKSAGLPTDLPILFESGDGSYINVNEQVLLDMVQSSEIQYEVIEQPNIIDNVTDPTQIKSIDDLSKSIERGEMMMGPKSYSLNYDKNDTEFNRHEDAINSLNAILPDNMESFADQQSYVVLEPQLQSSSQVLNNQQAPHDDFSCIDGDEFFSKAMGEDVKKYYEGQQLDDTRNMELCPTSSSLDTHFSMSLLDTKSTNLDSSGRQNVDSYDFELQLAQGPDALDCLIATPKRIDDEKHLDEVAQKKAEIIKDLLDIENNMHITKDNDPNSIKDITQDNDDIANFGMNNNNEINNYADKPHNDNENNDNVMSPVITSSALDWDCVDLSSNKENECNNPIDRMDVTDNLDNTNTMNESCASEDNVAMRTNYDKSLEDSIVNSSFDQDIPFAVGLLPMKQVSGDEDTEMRRSSQDTDSLDDMDAKCLKRKAKYKKL